MSEYICNAFNPSDPSLACTKPVHAFGMHAHDPTSTYWEGLPIPGPGNSKKSKSLMGDISKAAQINSAKLGDDVTWVSPNHPETAVLAAANYLGKTGTLRESIYRFIESRGPDGATDDEIEIELSRSHQSVSGARNTLVRSGLVKDSGVRRLNRYGNLAIAWCLLSF